MRWSLIQSSLPSISPMGILSSKCRFGSLASQCSFVTSCDFQGQTVQVRCGRVAANDFTPGKVPAEAKKCCVNRADVGPNLAQLGILGTAWIQNFVRSGMGTPWN